MMYLLVLALITAGYVDGRKFNNPILSDESYNYPNAIKVDGTYYVVALSWNVTDGVFPVHTSTDLNEWKRAGYIFNDINKPEWAQKNSIYFPKIHQIGENFVLYFSADNPTNQYVYIGVATASHPLGPYSTSKEPFISAKSYSLYPTVINDQGNLYLMWCNASDAIVARKLDSTGLSFSSDETTTLLEPSLDWEKGNLYNPWYIQRGGYHYLLYYGGLTCNSYVVGVARSSKVLGPYEKLPNPILVPNEQYACTSDASVVKDLDNKNDVIVFDAYRSDDPDHNVAVLLATLSWNADDWPYVEDF